MVNSIKGFESASTNIVELVIIKILQLSALKTLLKKSDDLKIPIYDNQYVTELLRENTCFGAMSFNLSTSD